MAAVDSMWKRQEIRFAGKQLGKDLMYHASGFTFYLGELRRAFQTVHCESDPWPFLLGCDMMASELALTAMGDWVQGRQDWSKGAR